MTYLLLFLTALANGAILFFLSILAVDGQGTGKLVFWLWRWGGAWIAVMTVLGFVLCLRGHKPLGNLVASAALPTGFVALLIYEFGKGYYETKTPNSPEFAAACTTAGAKYLATPAAPVESVAYDWEGQSAPHTTHFTIGDNGHVTDIWSGAKSTQFPSQIRFVENRCCRFEGGAPNKVGPYIRRPNPGYGHDGVSELTADVLVHFRSAPVGPQTNESSLKQVDVSVVDRRDGRALATLRYLLDETRRRGCGTTVGDSMDERAFVLKAINLQ